MVAMTVTAYTDAAPGPRVVVNTVTVPTGTSTATLHRRYEDRDDVVPGADGITATGGFVRTDYYAPIGVPVTYQPEFFDVNGASLGFGDAVSTFLQVPDSTAWLTSPYDPNVSVQIDMDDEAGGSLRLDIAATTHQIGGRKIMISESVYGYQDLPMGFWVATVDDARAAEEVFRDGIGFAVFRVAPPMEVPRLMYAYGIPDRTETNLPAGVQDTHFGITVEVVDPPSTVIILAALPYSRYTNNIATYAEFKSRYSTYRAALLTPPAES